MTVERLMLRRWRQQEASGETIGVRLSGPMVTLISLLLFLPPVVQARQWAHQTAPGIWRTLDLDTISTKNKHLNQTTVSFVANRITWNVTYQDPPGQGFNDLLQGPARKATVYRVLDYISHVLSYTTGTLDILFQPSLTDGKNVLALTYTPFPGISSPAGFYNGLAFEHIQARIDPDPAVPDIYCTVNFGFTWYAGTGTPISSEYDLATVLLHEVTHGLGFVSLAEVGGTSHITHQNPGIFSVWDSLLQTGGGFNLWAAGGTFVGNPASLRGSIPGVYFNGTFAIYAFGSRPPVYTPSVFQEESSLSHWIQGIWGGAVMEPAIGAGQVKRVYAPVDLGALEDIGWHVQGVNAAEHHWNLYP